MCRSEVGKHTACIKYWLLTSWCSIPCHAYQSRPPWLLRSLSSYHTSPPAAAYAGLSSAGRRSPTVSSVKGGSGAANAPRRCCSGTGFCWKVPLKPCSRASAVSHVNKYTHGLTCSACADGCHPQCMASKLHTHPSHCAHKATHQKHDAATGGDLW